MGRSEGAFGGFPPRFLSLFGAGGGARTGTEIELTCNQADDRLEVFGLSDSRLPCLLPFALRLAP